MREGKLMGMRAGPPFDHARGERVGVLLTNLGTPQAPTASAVRPYLREFLSDPRVVEIPRAVWWFILNGAILPFRARSSAEKYAKIWAQEGSPLKVWTERQARLVRGNLGERGVDVEVAWAMRYGAPAISQALDELKQKQVGRILVVPLYPQYSAATTASTFDAVFAWCKTTRNLPELRLVKHYHDHPAYIAAMATRIRDAWMARGGVRPQRLLLSFHGMPRRSLDRGDPYFCECQKSARLLTEALGLLPSEVEVAFQSRFGRARWLEPYTAPTLIGLPGQGVGVVDVFCPGFVSDCLETLEEINIEARHGFLEAGGKEFNYIECLNDQPEWIGALTDVIVENLAGWPTHRLGPADETLGRERLQRARGKGAAG